MAYICKCGQAVSVGSKHKCPKPKSITQIIKEQHEYTIKFLRNKKRNEEWMKKHPPKIRFGSVTP